MDGKDLVFVFSVLRNIRFITAPIKCHVSNVANIKVYHGYFDIVAIDFFLFDIVHYLNINNVTVGTLVKHPARTYWPVEVVQLLQGTTTAAIAMV